VSGYFAANAPLTCSGCYLRYVSFVLKRPEARDVGQCKMADDFDVIYEVDGADDDGARVDSAFAAYVPDPVVIKGAGNITVYAAFALQSLYF